MEDMKKTEMYASAPMGQLLAKTCIPVIVTILVVILYNMADIFFVGQTGDSMQVAAIVLASPVFAVLSGLGTLLGSGGCAAIAIALGKKEEKKARETSSFCFYTAIVIGIAFMVVVMAGMEGILRILNTSSETQSYVRTYLTVTCMGAPFILFSNAFANIVRAEGAVKQSLLGNGIGSVLNIILDPILIIGLDMGVMGAALATVISNIAGSIYLLWFIHSKKSSLSANIKDFSIRKEVSIKTLSLGLPMAVGVFLSGVSGIVSNHVVGGYGDVAIAAAGVAGKMGMIVSMVQMGICMGVQPALAFNYGAGNDKRIAQIIKSTVLVTITVGVLSSMGCWFFKERFLLSFINDADIVALGTKFIIGGIITGPIFGVCYLCANILQATERVFRATLASLLRQGMIYIPAIFIMNALMGLTGVVFASAISDMISAAIGIILCVWKRRDSVTCGRVMTL